MRSLLALTVAFWAIPVAAQTSDHASHDMPGMDMPDMDMPATETTPTDAAPPEPAQHDADHAMGAMDMPAPDAMSHSMHGMPADAAKPLPHASAPAPALTGPAHAADAFYPADEMAHARAMMTHEMGGLNTTLVMLDRLEVQAGKGSDSWAWEGSLRTGGDIDRLRIKTEGEGELGGGIDEAEAQVLWSHAIGPWFDLQAGARHQFLQGPDRTQLSLGVEGLAPYMFDVAAEAFVSTQGELTAKVSAEIDQRLTQRLILQPRVEANLSAQDIPETGLGSGLTSLQAGLRLRYEIRREFAPYVGLEWHRQFGRTATMTRAAGGDPDRIVAVFGIRAWF